METTSEAGATAALPWAEATAAPLNLLRFKCSPSMVWPKTCDWCCS